MFWYTVLSAIDDIFFKLVRDCFKIVLYLADVEIFSESVIKDFSNRIYMLLAVIMFFKIAVSTIQYLVDPEKLSDSTSGAGAIIKNSAIAIILLAVVPEVFHFARSAQSDLAGYIPAIIMGDNYQGSSSDSKYKQVNESANSMTSTVMQIFYTPKSDKTKFAYGKTIQLEHFREQVIKDGCDDFDIWHLDKYFSTDNCSWNYVVILPVVVAGLMIFVLVSMAIDIAIRAIKFALLEIMAPIPIVSYIDKGGKGAFESWLKEVKDVYLDLFIRIAVVYFIIFVIDKVVKDFNAHNLLKHMNGESDFMKGLVLIFIIIGLLLFGKTAPKYLCDALGIKGTDKLSPMFKRAGALLGAGASGLTAGAANLQNARARIAGMKESGAWGALSARDKLRERIKAAASGAAGTSSAMYRGGRSALSGKSMKEAFNTGHKGAVTARQNRELDALNDLKGYEGFKERMTARAQDFMGLDTRESLAEAKQKAYSTLHSDVGNFKKAVLGRLPKTLDIAMKEGDGSSTDQLGSILHAHRAAIATAVANHTAGADTLARMLSNFDASGKLRADHHINYHDLQSVIQAATTAGITEISSRVQVVEQNSQKEIFAQSIEGRVKDTSGNFIDALNYGDKGYEEEGKTRSKGAHVDITTAIEATQQHIAENAVPLSGGKKTAEQLQQEFITDYATMDDQMQAASARLSSEMASSRARAARESNKRKASNAANKDK